MSPNSRINSDVSDSIPTDPIEHKQQVTGIWIPIELWELVTEEGALSFLELRLLMYINGLVKVKGIGCWASKAHFASKFNRSPNVIRQMLGKLIDMGYLLEVGWVTVRNLKYRILETSWSRIKPMGNKKETEKSIEDKLREELKGVFVKVRLDVFGDRETSRGIESKPPRGNEIEPPRGNEIEPHMIHSYSKNELEENCRGGADDGVSPALPKKPKQQKPTEHEEGFTTTGSKSFRVKCIKKLYLFLKQNKLLETYYKDTPIGPWDQPFKELEKLHSQETIESVLNGFIKYYKDQYMPRARCASKFHKKFQSIKEKVEELRGESKRIDIPKFSKDGKRNGSVDFDNYLSPENQP